MKGTEKSSFTLTSDINAGKITTSQFLHRFPVCERDAILMQALSLFPLQKPFMEVPDIIEKSLTSLLFLENGTTRFYS